MTSSNNIRKAAKSDSPLYALIRYAIACGALTLVLIYTPATLM